MYASLLTILCVCVCGRAFYHFEDRISIIKELKLFFLFVLFVFEFVFRQTIGGGCSVDMYTQCVDGCEMLMKETLLNSWKLPG